jgi:rare lipoprotein A
MSSIACAGASGVDREAGRRDAQSALSAFVGRAVRLFAVVVAAASLAACAQSSVLSKRSSLFAPSRQASLERERTSPLVRRAAFTPAPFAPRKDAAGSRMVSQGIASFYTEGTRTASGEKFDANELTAAHPTLPFGTRLRVTNVATGRSVTVRVNDRGPYVAGRVVDVSYSAANALGMVGRGVAKVKLDVVE